MYQFAYFKEIGEGAFLTKMRWMDDGTLNDFFETTRSSLLLTPFVVFDT